ncbi:MAG: hypothetical protein JOZ63_15240 [Planctomycetaceae bacterium]|nr:hypothetical protein [Planctomycetaceae bacterium]
MKSHCLRGGKEAIEVRYYLSGLGMDVKRFARAVELADRFFEGRAV